MKRDLQIIQLRQKRVTLAVIAKKFGLTPERVRQIYERSTWSKCSIHKSPFLKTCEFCTLEQTYEKRVKSLPMNRLLQEVLALTKENREKAVVIKRKILIKLLKNDHKLNLSEIGRLIKRDHSSIRNLYKK